MTAELFRKAIAHGAESGGRDVDELLDEFLNRYAPQFRDSFRDSR